MNEEIKKNLTSSKHWLRFLYMALFVFILYFASIVMFAVVILQAVFTLLSGDDSLRIKKFGDSLSQYIFSALQFLIYNSDEKPFPFADWPESNAQESVHEVEEESWQEPEQPEQRQEAEVEQQPDSQKDNHTMSDDDIPTIESASTSA